jgi:hypothetical protein
VKVRFLADADLNRAIVSGVQRREPSLDFLTAQAAGLRGMNDPAILALAAERQRVLVSHDVGTMPAHFRAFRNAGKHSSGVLVAVGTTLASGPPHGSAQAGLRHAALPSDKGG